MEGGSGQRAGDALARRCRMRLQIATAARPMPVPTATTSASSNQNSELITRNRIGLMESSPSQHQIASTMTSGNTKAMTRFRTAGLSQPVATVMAITRQASAPASHHVLAPNSGEEVMDAEPPPAAAGIILTVTDAASPIGQPGTIAAPTASATAAGQ